MFRFCQYLIKKSDYKAILFLFISLFASLEYIILGPFSYARIGDNVDTFLPRLLSGGVATRWYPFLAGGVDGLSNEITRWSVGNFIFSLFPNWLGYAAVILGGCWVGGYFIYRLCRHLEIDHYPSVFAGSFFILSLLLVDILPFILGLAILPLFVYCLEIFWNKYHRFNLAASAFIFLTAGLLFSFFSSLIFTLPFTLAAIWFWFFIFRQHWSARNFFLLSVFSVSALMPHWAQFGAMLANAHFSSRALGDYFNAGFSNYFVLLFEIVSHNWPALAVVIFCLVFFKVKDARLIKISALILLLLFISPFYPLVASLIAGDGFFKLFKNYSFERFYLIIPFFASVASGLALNLCSGSVNVVGKPSYDLKKVLSGIGLSLLLLSALILKINHLSGWLRSGGYTAHTASPEVAALANTLDRQNPFRLATIVSGSGVNKKVIPTLPHFYGLETIDGHANFTSKRFLDFFNLISVVPAKSSFYLFAEPTSAEVESFKSDSSKFINFNLLSLANVRFILSMIPIKAPGVNIYAGQLPDWSRLSERDKILSNLRDNFSGRRVMIFENSNFFPRFFLAKETRVFDKSDDLLSALARANTSTLRSVAFLDRNDIISDKFAALPRYDDSGSIQVLNNQADRVDLIVSAKEHSFLIVTNNYHPAWKVFINGTAGAVVPVDRTFMGVPLAAGDNHLTLQYQP